MIIMRKRQNNEHCDENLTKSYMIFNECFHWVLSLIAKDKSTF